MKTFLHILSKAGYYSVIIRWITLSSRLLNGRGFSLYLIKESFFDSDISEGHSWRLDHAKRTCDDLIQELAENDDDIREELYYTTLKDLGFEPDFHANFRWEKVVEDTNEKEVVEEVVFLNKILHRKRTIIWKEIEHGKSSKEIIYESLKVDKRLRTIVENTRRIYNIKERK